MKGTVLGYFDRAFDEMTDKVNRQRRGYKRLGNANAERRTSNAER